MSDDLWEVDWGGKGGGGAALLLLKSLLIFGGRLILQILLFLFPWEMLHLGLGVEELKKWSSSGRDISHTFMSWGFYWFFFPRLGQFQRSGLVWCQSQVWWDQVKALCVLGALAGHLFTPASQFLLKCGRLIFLRPLSCVEEGSDVAGGEGVPKQAQTNPGWGVWSQQAWTAGVSLEVASVRAGVLICFWFPCFVFYFCILFGFQLIFKFWNVFLHILVPKAVPYAVCDGVWPSVHLNNFLSCIFSRHSCAEPKLFFQNIKRTQAA